MAKYILKRFAYMLVTLFCITAATFFLMHSIPGDPLSYMAKKLPEQTRINYYAKYGLDKSKLEQFGIFLENVVTKGDFGESLRYPGRSVTDTILKGSAVSATVGFQALIIGVTIGIVLGIVAAYFRNRWPDYLIMFLAILGVTIPVFVFASVMQYIFTVKYRLLPTTGWGGLREMVLPVITLALGSIAGYARYMKSSVLEVINQDYILTARAKGVSEFNILRRHVLRNAFIPDYTMIIGTTVFYAILFVAIQLVVDILYGVVDPRITLTKAED